MGELYKLFNCSPFSDYLQCMTYPLSSTNKPQVKLATIETLQHIKNVIADTTVPSWVGSVLQNFGDAAAGTLKADEWRTLGTIYLPLALISIWGQGTPHKSDYEGFQASQVLNHTMLLVSAVNIASKHSVSKSRSFDYLDQMSQYLSGLQVMHPDATFHPYHHLALHLPHFFQLFGPSRCFWTYPFERVIGQIQRLLSNHQIGM